MRVSSNRVVLENDADVIDYLTKGISPSKKDLEKIKQGLTDGNLFNQGNNLIKSHFTAEDLDLIYKNKRRNETITLIMVGGIAIIAFMCGYKSAIKGTVRTIDKQIDHIEKQNNDFMNNLSKRGISFLDDDDIEDIVNTIGTSNIRGEINARDQHGNMRTVRF